MPRRDRRLLRSLISRDCALERRNSSLRFPWWRRPEPDGFNRETRMETSRVFANVVPFSDLSNCGAYHSFKQTAQPHSLHLEKLEFSSGKKSGANYRHGSIELWSNGVVPCAVHGRRATAVDGDADRGSNVLRHYHLPDLTRRAGRTRPAGTRARPSRIPIVMPSSFETRSSPQGPTGTLFRMRLELVTGKERSVPHDGRTRKVAAREATRQRSSAVAARNGAPERTCRQAPFDLNGLRASPGLGQPGAGRQRPFDTPARATAPFPSRIGRSPGRGRPGTGSAGSSCSAGRHAHACRPVSGPRRG